MINARKNANVLAAAQTMQEKTPPNGPSSTKNLNNPLQNESIVSSTLLNDVELFNNNAEGQSQQKMTTTFEPGNSAS